MTDKLNVERFLQQCTESGDQAYNALKGVLELLENPSSRAEARVFLSSLQDFVNQRNASDGLSIYHFHIHELSLTGYEGFRKDRQSLILLELPSIFIPEDWSFTFFEGINRLPDSVFRDRDVAELGCGNGWISIALAEKWSPRKMYGLDINPRAIKAAWINLYLNALDKDGTPVVDYEGKTLLDRVEFHESDLFAYCRMHSISLDRIVGCIPQILNPDPLAMQKIITENASEEFLYSLSNYCALQGFVEDQFGLGLVARAAEEGISVMRPSGTMIFNIGGRPGQAVCERLFERRGFNISKLWQTRVNQAPDTDILALVEIENKSRHRFEFFMGRVSEEPISARTAWSYLRSGGEISHGLSVYSCQLRQPNQVKTIFQFLSKSFPETRGALDLSFEDESVAEEKIPFLAHLARALESTASIAYELPVGNTQFRTLVARFLCSYHDIPIDQNNIIVYPSRAAAIEHFLCLFSPQFALVEESLTKLLPQKWLTSFLAEQFGKGPGERLFGASVTVVEAPKRVDLVLQLLLRLKPQVLVSSLADFEMKSSTAFERLLDACSQVGARLLLDISDHVELSSLPGTNGVLQYLSAQALPSHATIVCGLLKNRVYSDLEVAFVISENKEVLNLMGKMGELLIGGTAISNQFYYGCLFQELLAFQLPGRHKKPMRLPVNDAEANFLKAPLRTRECLSLAESWKKKQGSDNASMHPVEDFFTTPMSAKMAIFEGFARQYISEMESNPASEINKFLNINLGIPDFTSKIVVSDSSKALFSKLAVGCRENSGTLFFPLGSNETYIQAAKLLGLDIRIIGTRPETLFKVTESVVVETFTTSDKPYLYISGPTIYPTGLVYSTSEIKAIIYTCSQYGVHVILDTSYSGQDFASLGSMIWDLQDVDCSSITFFGTFSFTFFLGGLEFGYAIAQGSFSKIFDDFCNISKPHRTLRYIMQKLLRLFNSNDTKFHEELMERRKLLHQRAEHLCQVLQECGWEPLKPLGGSSLIARPVAYERNKLHPENSDVLAMKVEPGLNNMAAIFDIAQFNALSCMPGYYKFNFSLKDADFHNALWSLREMKGPAIEQ